MLLLHDRVHRESVTFGGVGRVLTLLLLLLLHPRGDGDQAVSIVGSVYV